jgi:hypothetical protein
MLRSCYNSWLRFGALAAVLALGAGTVLAPAATAQYNLPVGGDRDSGIVVTGDVDHVIRPALRGEDPIADDWVEGFEDISLLPGDGWVIQNNSNPEGSASWFQGNPNVFESVSGPPNAYIGVNFNSTAGVGTISNWLVTPHVVLQNGTELTFWTRTGAGSIYPDRLQVRMSTEGASSDVGIGDEDTGDFTELLLDINPDLQQGGYPEGWASIAVVVEGLDEATSGRFAFRYYVHGGGPSGDNSNYIGIDEVSVTQPAVSTDDDAVATGFAVDQNFPNPARGLTTIGYVLDQAAAVRVDVFDVMGRLVTTLVDGHQPAGAHTAVWDVSDVASGVYVYRVQAGDQVHTRRAMVAR